MMLSVLGPAVRLSGLGLGLAVRLQLRKAHQIVGGLKVILFVDDLVLSQDVALVSLAHKKYVKALESQFHCRHWLSRAVLARVEQRPQVLERNRQFGSLRVGIPQLSLICPEFNAKPSHKPAVLVRVHFVDNEPERVSRNVLLDIFLGLLLTGDDNFELSGSRETVFLGLDSRNNLGEPFVQLLHHLVLGALVDHRMRGGEERSKRGSSGNCWRDFG
jgi:hypothetical protein